MQRITPTGKERFFDRDSIIVSKTSPKGLITYVNHTFIDISSFHEDELLGRPHNIIRHPSMPRCVFKLLWDKLQAKKEIFAYVVNMSKNGDHYWVLAHVTPSLDSSGNILGYHSNRRVPDKAVLQDVIIPLYKSLLQIESANQNYIEGMTDSYNHLLNIINEKGLTCEILTSCLHLFTIRSTPVIFHTVSCC